MRLLVACPSCQRQYDASGRTAGDRFHCSCGEVLSVPSPRGHDASVVRCSSCGASREDQAMACNFCGADFSLHERDLHTICPGCLARVSDRARFCHHCALPLAPQGTAGEATDHLCPACGDGAVLASRGLGGRGISVLECGRCAGLWLGREIFELLEREARERSAGREELGPTAPPPLPWSGTAARQEGPLYRPCAHCRRLMNRRNYGKKSGVVVDECREHGIWFDAGELDRVLAWVRDGGLARSERLAAEEARWAERQKKLHREGDADLAPLQGERRSRWGSTVTDILGELILSLLD